MKIALVHELLTMRGGAERVLKVFADMFPDAPIYTLLYDEKKLGSWFPRERVRISHTQKSWLPAPLRFNHHLHLSRFPAAVEAWDFSEFDLVLSSSSAFAHGVITNGRPKHLCYVQSPARYLWDRTHDVLERAGRGPLGWLRRRHLERVFHDLRIWDSEAADRPDELIAASQEVQRRIELYWRRPSTVITPPIDDAWLNVNHHSSPSTEQFFLIVSTLSRYKNIDLAIRACNELKLHLIIAGEGPDRRRLEKIAGPTIKFLGYRSHDELVNLFAGAQATIVPGDEDFNLVALESMACGTPVVALRKGGPLETIVEGETGAFFDPPVLWDRNIPVPHNTYNRSLTDILKSFRRDTFNSDRCRARAQEFSRKRFETQITERIAALQM